MFDRSAGFPTLIGVMASQIELPFEVQPTCHVWVKSKRPDVEIQSDMTQYLEGIERSA
jgi:hypothetical protein